jgi:hypothetical protein
MAAIIWLAAVLALARAAVVPVSRALPARMDVFLLGSQTFALESGATLDVHLVAQVRGVAVCARTRSAVLTWDTPRLRAATDGAIPVYPVRAVAAGTAPCGESGASCGLCD